MVWTCYLILLYRMTLKKSPCCFFNVIWGDMHIVGIFLWTNQVCCYVNH